MNERIKELLELAAKAAGLTRTLRPDASSITGKRYFYAAGPRLIEMGARA